jgi:anthranilate phosphoribosyltransferase
MTKFSDLLSATKTGRTLSRPEMRAAMDILLDGRADEEEVAEFLTVLKNRGETVEEIVAAAEAMRAKALQVSAPEGSIDTCGTGGDGADTFNISTAVALIVAGCGIPVAKHGNRAASSRSGSSDVLAALGVNIHVTREVIERCIREANIGFLFAAYHHRAVANVAVVRKKLGVRTIFNVLGPLANPAGAKRQLMGVYDRALTEPLAHALGVLGAVRAWVVAGTDGLDEITTTSTTFVSEFHQGAVRSFEVAPEDIGVPRATSAALKGGSPSENAAAIKNLLSGAEGPFRDIALLNAAAAILVAGRATTLSEGANIAADSINRGRAAAALDKLVSISNEEC